MIDPEKKQQIESMVQSNEEFRRLHEEHSHLSFHVEELSKRRNLSDTELEQLRELKKKKLQTKDAMGRMLFDEEMRQKRH